MTLKRGDSVYVNGRLGIVTKVHEDGYTVKTDSSGFIQKYPIDKVIKRHNHCQKCKRRIASDINLCGFCKRNNI